MPHSDLGDRAADLHRRAREGDIEARNEIVEANLALAPWFMTKFGKRYPHLDEEEIVAHALDGIIRAAELYDPAVSRFATYAVHWMRSKVGRANAGAQVWFGEPVNLYQSSTDTYMESVSPAAAERLRNHLERERVALGDWDMEGREADPVDILIEREGADAIPWKALPRREREMVRMYFEYDGPATLETVGREFGISRERTRQIVDRAVVKMRKAADRIQRGKACSSSD
jgi:RNA polymerase sigma factor (sigma-70 family)